MQENSCVENKWIVPRDPLISYPWPSNSAQGRAGQGRAGQGRAGQGRAGQGRAGQGRAGQGRAGQAWFINCS